GVSFEDLRGGRIGRGCSVVAGSRTKVQRIFAPNPLPRCGTPGEAACSACGSFRLRMFLAANRSPRSSRGQAFAGTCARMPALHRRPLNGDLETDMAAKNKVIIPCAITGSIHTPSMSPHLPITPDQIAESAIGAAEAGAAIVHLHARHPQTGRPDQSPEAFMKFVPRIKQRTN